MKIREKIDILKTELFTLYPDAITELEYENNFQLLIAVVMSAQTTDKQVNIVNKTFFQHLKTPADGVTLGTEKIRSLIRQVNFFNNKAKNIFKTCEILSEKNLDDMKTVEELTKLPGVGIKTAKVFLAVVYDMPFLAVDTHVHRVLNRVGIVNTKMPEETDKRAEKIFTPDDLAKLHHSLIMFGRYHCIARKPKCQTIGGEDAEVCELQNICRYYKNKIKK